MKIGAGWLRLACEVCEEIGGEFRPVLPVAASNDGAGDDDTFLWIGDGLAELVFRDHFALGHWLTVEDASGGENGDAGALGRDNLFFRQHLIHQFSRSD